MMMSNLLTMKSEIKIRSSSGVWEVIHTIPFKMLGSFDSLDGALNYKTLMEKCLLKI